MEYPILRIFNLEYEVIIIIDLSNLVYRIALL